MEEEVENLAEKGAKATGNFLKNKIMAFISPFLIKGALILLVAIIIIALIGVLFSITASAIKSAEEEEAKGGEMAPATGTSWEQYLRYCATKEGGSNDGVNYFVEDDYAGNPTIGHGLCIYSTSENSYLHKEQFAVYGYDTEALVAEYEANKVWDNNSGKYICYTATVPIEICDEIWSNLELSWRLEEIKNLHSHLNLKEYQYYALLDVKYRRGTTGPYKGDPSFNDQYANLWSDSDNKYGEYVEADESFSLSTLYNFFWNQGHGLEGVRVRKKDQWVLFKYGYYRPLNEYWQESTVFSGDLYNADGTVNEEKITELQTSLESTYGLVAGNLSGNNIGGRYNGTTCKAVKGTYLGYSHSVSDTEYDDTVDGVKYVGKNGLGIYQCTWWANGRASEYLGRAFEVTGDGGQIYANASGKYNRGSTPKPNSLVSYTKGGGHGHVAYVEAVDTINGYYYISHAGSGLNWYGIQKVKIGAGPWSGYTTLGFVYLDEPIGG